jgi:magnesium transporter
VKTENAILTFEEIHQLIDGDDQSLRAYFSSVPYPADISEFFEKVEVRAWPRLLRLIDDPEIRSEVVALFDESRYKDLLGVLSPDEISALLGEMESDDAADFIAILPFPKRMEVLRKMAPQERKWVQQLLKYPEDSAGGIMQLELAEVPENALVSDAVDRVRELVEDDVEVLAVWVVDNEGRLRGHVALVDLLLHKATTPVAALMDPDVVSVTALIDQEEVAQLFKKYDLITLPVVDDQDRLIGRIVVDDVVDVLEEEAEEDALRMGGTSSEELYHRQEVVSTARIRLPWLAVALGCSLISATLIKSFEPILERVAIVFAFLPVIMAMGGNVGTQTSTILIRGIATQKIDMSDLPKFLYKELRVGALLGVIYGLLAGVVATFVLSNYNYPLGLIVFISMVCAGITAAGMGVCAPAILKKFDFDPAIASGPFVTSLNDISGILIYMSTAGLFLSYLEMQ